MQKHIKFSLCRGRGALVGLSIIFHMFSAFHQNEFKAFLSILDTYIFFPYFWSFKLGGGGGGGGSTDIWKIS